MPADSRPVIPDARHAPHRLLGVLPHERVARGAADSDLSVLASDETDADAALIERAKGALMLHYGVDSHQAFAVLVGWARTSGSPVATIAHTLLRGICEGNPQTEVRQRALMRYLEAQLRTGDPGQAQLRTVPARLRTGS